MCEQLIEFFQGPRYRINTFLLSLNGLWSYQKKSQSIFLLAVTLWFSLSDYFGLIRNICIHRSDWSIILSTLGTLLVQVATCIKVFNSLYFADKIRQLLERIYLDWHAPMGPEKTVLAKFADDGRVFTITYTVWLYGSTVVYLALSTVPRILIANGWANITTSTLLPIPVNITENDEDHYVFLQTYICIGILIVLTVPIAVDTMFVVFIQHGCGIFAAVSYRLEHLINREDLQVDLHPHLLADESFWTVVDCIQKHNEAIEYLNRFERFYHSNLYADQLASVYSWSFFSMLALNMLSMSFTGLQVLTTANRESFDEAVRQILFVCAQLIHLFFENYFSQRLTDQNVEVATAVTKSKWYLCSMRTRVLLRMILARCATPWKMQAGKLFTMSLANFGAVIRTSLSYLTIFASIE